MTLDIQKFLLEFTILETVHPIFSNFERIYRNILNVAIFHSFSILREGLISFLFYFCSKRQKLEIF